MRPSRNIPTSHVNAHGVVQAAPPRRRAIRGGRDRAAQPGLAHRSTWSAEILPPRPHQGHAKCLLAVDGSDATAGFILATGKPVIAMGGFLGADPAPTLDQFKRLVAAGEVHYVLVSSGPAGGGPPSSSQREGAPSGLAAAGERQPTGLPGRAEGLPVPNASRPALGPTAAESIDRWVELHGTKVPASAYGGSAGSVLYYLR